MPSILVLDDSARVPQWLRDHFGIAYHVIGTHSVRAAIDALERHDIGVIVTSDTVGGEGTETFLHALGRRYPQIVAVVLTARQDAGLVARLIGDVKVCRVLFKPVKTGAVELALEAAMTRHVGHRAVAATARRAALVARAEPTAGVGLRQSLRERMRARLGLLARLAGATT